MHQYGPRPLAYWLIVMAKKGPPGKPIEKSFNAPLIIIFPMGEDDGKLTP